MLQRAALRSDLLNGNNIPDIKTLEDYDLTGTENPLYGSIMEKFTKPEPSVNDIEPYSATPMNNIEHLSEEADLNAVNDPQLVNRQYISNDEELLRTYDDLHRNLKFEDGGTSFQRNTILYPNVKNDLPNH